MTPVVNGFAAIMAAVDTPDVLGDDLAFGDEDELRCVDMQADGPVGKCRRHAITVAVEIHQAGWRDELGVLDKAVECLADRHQMGPLDRPRVPDRRVLLRMLRLLPEQHALVGQPVVQCGERTERRHRCHSR